MKRIIPLLKFSLILGVLYFLYQSGKLNPEKMKALIADPGLFMGLLSIVSVFMLGVSILRWWIFVKATGYEALVKTFSIAWIGTFFSTFLPGAVSGDLVKGYYVIKMNQGKSRAPLVASLFVDRLMGLFAIFLFSAVSLSFGTALAGNARATQLSWVVLSILAGLLIGAWLVLFPLKNDPLLIIINRLPLKEKFLKMHNALALYRQHKLKLFIGILLSLVIQLAEAISFYLILTHLGVLKELPTELLGMVALGELSTVVPLAPVGIGLRHVAFEGLFGLIGVTEGANAFNLFTLVRLVVCLLGGIPYFLNRPSVNIQLKEIDQLDQEMSS